MQRMVGVGHCVAVDPELRRQLVDGRQPLAGREIATRTGRFNLQNDLLVDRGR